MVNVNNGSAEGRPPRILVVEDEFLLRAMAAEYLEDCGFAIFQAQTADEAIGVLRSEMDIDAVFSDVQMPGSMTGFGLAHWISDTLPDIKVLLTSGLVVPSDATQWNFLSKPYDLVRVERRLRELVVHA